MEGATDEGRVVSISILLWISKGAELSGAMVQDIVLCICLQPADVRVRLLLSLSRPSLTGTGIQSDFGDLSARPSLYERVTSGILIFIAPHHGRQFQL